MISNWTLIVRLHSREWCAIILRRKAMASNHPEKTWGELIPISLAIIPLSGKDTPFWNRQNFFQKKTVEWVKKNITFALYSWCTKLKIRIIFCWYIIYYKRSLILRFDLRIIILPFFHLKTSKLLCVQVNLFFRRYWYWSVNMSSINVSSVTMVTATSVNLTAGICLYNCFSDSWQDWLHYVR